MSTTSRRNSRDGSWLATITIKNAPGTDVLAQRLDRSAVIAVQTKTASPGSAFQLSLKDEAPGDRDNEWFALVSLGEILARPSFYILPRHVLAAITFLQHRDWLGDMGRLHSPQRAPRRDNPRRTIRPPWIAGYLERWDLLDGSARTAPTVIGSQPDLLGRRHASRISWQTSQ